MKKSRAALIAIVSSLGWIILAGSTPTSQLMIYSLEKRFKPVDTSSIVRPYPDRILILGGGHTVSPGLPAGTQLSLVASSRLAEAIRVYQLLGGVKLVCSGFSASHRITQAEMLATAALELGVDPSDTIQLRTPSRTKEELLAFKTRFGPGPVVVVSSARHMPRIMMLAEQMGVMIIPAPTDYMLKEDTEVYRFDFYPSVQKLAMMESALHEYLGLIEIWM